MDEKLLPPLPSSQAWDELEASLGLKTQQAKIAQQAREQESMDFEETESVAWRKHQLRRFFQDRGSWWSSSRRTTIWKWILVIVLGSIIACMGVFVRYLTTLLTETKMAITMGFIEDNQWVLAFFVFLLLCQAFALVAGLLCVIEPAAAGSGIPEIKAYLNGINLNKSVRVKVLVSKVLGMCFSCASGLPLGKEGPMIHAGSIVGAAVSQGKTITFGFDTSWTKFQDLRNDRSKRDFVTFGAAAGVAAAFSAPIGGILFTLEEGASFWSTTLTFRAFFCAMITELTINLITQSSAAGGNSRKSILGLDQPTSMFDFGAFNSFNGYHTYELIIFLLIGVLGGVLGSGFNYFVKCLVLFRRERYADDKLKRILELLFVTGLFASISFLAPFSLPSSWICSELPTQISTWAVQEQSLLGKLVQFQCQPGEYNQLASLMMVDADTALQQLFHFQNGATGVSFTTLSLITFFILYFFFATITAGVLCPAGLFVPMLLSGATLGRMIGHLLQMTFPYAVTDSGTYALIGAAALLGGMSRMTIAGTVILLEACGNNEFLLPLMLTFAAARYSGNALNAPIYEMQISLLSLPFLEGQLKAFGLLNYHPIVEVMARPVRTLYEINRVVSVYELLNSTAHNGFPVVSSDGQLRGLILRKTLCSLLRLKGFSTPSFSSSTNLAGGGTEVVKISSASSFFFDTLERHYPHYPKIEECNLSPSDLNSWIDLRPYMDTAPYALNESSSIARCYRLFRTMGLRHLVVLDNHHRVTGIVTRKDITESRLENLWFSEGDNIQQFLNVDKEFEHARVNEFESVGALVPVVNNLGGYGGGRGDVGGGGMEGFEVSTRSSLSSQIGGAGTPPTTSIDFGTASSSSPSSTLAAAKRDMREPPSGGRGRF